MSLKDLQISVCRSFFMVFFVLFLTLKSSYDINFMVEGKQVQILCEPVAVRYVL